MSEVNPEEKLDVRNIQLDSIVANAWNPNEMDDETFNRLAEEIQSVGFLDPIQVVQMEDGTYRILGGEHRFHAVKILGWETIPAVVLSDEKWRDEDLQKFVTVRLNILRGKTNPAKMVELYDEMAEKYGEDALQGMFAYTDQDAWSDTLKMMGKAIKKSLPKDVSKRFDDAKGEIKTVDDLSNILNTLFAKYGNTLDKSFMVFAYGGKEHVYVEMDKDMAAKMKKIREFCVENERDINEVLSPAVAEAVRDLPT